MRLKTAFTVIAGLLGGSVLSWTQQSDSGRLVIRDAQAKGQEQVIRANENRNPAGKLENGVLRLRLVMAQGTWYPEADEYEPSLQVPVFGEEGGPLTNPGPLIRVPEGTELHISVKNLYHKPLFVHGLAEGQTKNSVKLEPGEVHEFKFQSGPAGTYEYWANLQDRPMFARGAEASQLTGAFIVDPPGAAVNDRVFVLGYWMDLLHPEQGFSAGVRQVLSVNGKSWPWTERLEYHVGEEVRWRWISGSGMPHPMHLHGAYFRIDSVGDGDKDTIFSPSQQRYEVTEPLGAGTRTITWVPQRPGHWLFHCHLLFHIMRKDGLGYQLTSLPDTHMADDPGAGMSGLVVGINVLPGKEEIRKSGHPRRLDLDIHQVNDKIAMTEREGRRTLGKSTGEMGPLLLLTQGELNHIDVHNHLASPTAVHWHGIELESYFDGVPGWNQDSHGVTAPIAPGKSFIAEMTPPRAGTFIYHTHWHDIEQLTSGLYGPLIVMPPGRRFDSDTDKVILISRGGPDFPRSPLLIDGSAQPAPLQLRVGTHYRFRLINITPEDMDLEVSLIEEDKPVTWTAIARDGRDLPAEQSIAQPALLRLPVGGTADFDYIATEKKELVFTAKQQKLVKCSLAVDIN